MTPFQVREETRHVFRHEPIIWAISSWVTGSLTPDWSPLDSPSFSLQSSSILASFSPVVAKIIMYGCGAGGGVDDTNAQGNVVEARSSMALFRNGVSFYAILVLELTLFFRRSPYCALIESGAASREEEERLSLSKNSTARRK